MGAEKHFPITIYYEDTDFTGVVYHANYLKYFERARTEYLGSQRLQRWYKESGMGFVVYKAALSWKKPAMYADVLDITSIPRVEGEYTLIFAHSAIRTGDGQLLAQGDIQLACVNRDLELQPLPGWVLQSLA